MSYWSFSGRGRQVSARGGGIVPHSLRSATTPSFSTLGRPPGRNNTRAPAAPTQYIRRRRRCALLLLRRRSSGKNSRRPSARRRPDLSTYGRLRRHVDQSAATTIYTAAGETVIVLGRFVHPLLLRRFVHFVRRGAGRRTEQIRATTGRFDMSMNLKNRPQFTLPS